MSQWTHVVGCIRVDGIPDTMRKNEVQKIFGPMCLFYAWNNKSTLPRGSEGSLQYQIIEYDKGFPWLTIPIWGDLRDFGEEDIPNIETWWKDLLSKFDETNMSICVRDGILLVQAENQKPHIFQFIEELDVQEQ